MMMKIERPTPAAPDRLKEHKHGATDGGKGRAGDVAHRGSYGDRSVQIRALADPLRLKILGALSGVPRTTKQVAEVLGEKPTKLYHHVEALTRVGLVRLTETRPNRGTTEKYFQAVAAQFQVGGSAFSPAGAKARSARETMLTSIIDAARKDLLDCAWARVGAEDRSQHGAAGGSYSAQGIAQEGPGRAPPTHSVDRDAAR